MENDTLENEINKIKLAPRELIAHLLGCSIAHAGNFRRGYSELNNTQAQILKKEAKLSPEAFVEIYKRYHEKDKED